MGKLSKRKGSEFERKVAKLIAEAYGVDWKEFLPRTPASGGLQWKGDLIPLKEFKEIFPYYTECKHQERWSWYQLFTNPSKSPLLEWFHKAEKESKGSSVLLVFTKDRAPVFVMVSELLLSFYSNVTELKVFDGEKFLAVLLLDDLLKFLVSGV